MAFLSEEKIGFVRSRLTPDEQQIAKRTLLSYYRMSAPMDSETTIISKGFTTVVTLQSAFILVDQRDMRVPGAFRCEPLLADRTAERLLVVGNG